MNNSKIKVAYVINDLLLGGAQVAVFAIVSRLDLERFHPVVYYLNDYPIERPSLRAAFERQGIVVRYIGSGGKTSIWRAIPGLMRLFRTDRPTIVHTHLVDATIAGSVAARLSGVAKVIIHEHQTHAHYSQKIRLAYRVLRSLVSLTLCYSPIIEEELFGVTKLLLAPPEELMESSYTVYNGVDIERIELNRFSLDRGAKRREMNTPLDALVITSIARLIPWKGQRILLEAFGRIASRFSHAHLWLIGEGLLLEELQTRSKELDLEDRVHLPGARTDTYELLLATDIAALALLYAPGESGEAIGISGFEAMGCGLPLIASGYASANALIRSEENGVLVKSGDVDALTGALEDLLENPEKRKQIGAAAAATIRGRMDWRRIVPIYERIYELI